MVSRSEAIHLLSSERGKSISESDFCIMLPLAGFIDCCEFRSQIPDSHRFLRGIKLSGTGYNFDEWIRDCRDGKNIWVGKSQTKYIQILFMEVVMFFELLNRVDTVLSVGVSLLSLWHFWVAKDR
ncbi:hypothetical protein ARJ62_15770 [Listeria monocytogenes]|nr:hypothetical protein [Listeria monocytogenes]